MAGKVMDRKEVVETLGSLQKAVNEKQPSENVVNILTQLKDRVLATEELLRVSLRPPNNLSPTRPALPFQLTTSVSHRS